MGQLSFFAETKFPSSKINTVNCCSGETAYFRHGMLRTALFWVVAQRVVLILYRRFGTTYRSYLPGSNSLQLDYLTLEYGTDRLYRNFGKGLPLHLRNSSEDRSYLLIRGLKKR